MSRRASASFEDVRMKRRRSSASPLMRSSVQETPPPPPFLRLTLDRNEDLAVHTRCFELL